MDFAGKVNAMLGRLDDSVAGYGRCVCGWVCLVQQATTCSMGERLTLAPPLWCALMCLVIAWLDALAARLKVSRRVLVIAGAFVFAAVLFFGFGAGFVW